MFLAFLFFALVFVLDAIFGLVNNRALSDYFQKERDARFVLQQTEVAYGLTVDAETGQRGYLLLNDPSYLDPYKKAASELPGVLLQLSRATSEDPGESALISDWKYASEQKLSELRSTIRLYQTGSKSQAFGLVKKGEGEALTEHLRNLRAQLVKREEIKLSATTDAVSSANRAIEAESYATVISALLLLTLFYFILRNYLNVQRLREQEKEHQARILEERVIERTEDLRLANEELEAFTYSVSHDLRAPLRTIFGFCTVLEDDLASSLNHEIKDSLGRIQRATIKMGTLIDDLLRLSRITKMEAVADEVNLSKLFESFFKEARSRGDRVAEIRISPDIVVRGDERLLRIVVDNIAGNAWKFTSQREITQIQVGSVPHEDQIEVFVKDNGAGFEQKYAHKLFEPFQRLHSDRIFEGTGVGLAIVARIIQRHGGTLTAVGAEGAGATFSFTLPKSGDLDEISPKQVP